MARRRHANDAQLPLDFESRSREHHAMLISALTLTGTLKQAPLARLVMYCERRYGDALGMPRDQIGARLGIAGRTVRRWLDRLTAAGILEVEARRFERGGCRANLVSIDWQRVQELALNRLDSFATDRPDNSANRPDKTTNRPDKLSGPIRNNLPLSLPKNSSTASSGAHTATYAAAPEEAEEVEQFIAKICRLLPAPFRIAEAVDAALSAGCSLGQLRQRCRWFQAHQGDWKSEHRKGVLYHGLAECRPDFADHQGWPYR